MLLLLFILIVLTFVALHRLSLLTQRVATTEARLTRIERALERLSSAQSTAAEVTPHTSPATDAASPAVLPGYLAPAGADPTSHRAEPANEPFARSAAARPVPEAAEPSEPSIPPLPETANLETEIGSRWMLIAGATVLVLGVGFFVKYAFENEWITESARVVIGTLLGAVALLAGGRFIAAGYDAYGRIVAAGGLSMMYLAAYAATALYNLVPPAAGFLWMVTVSAVTVLTADRQKSLPLALVALVLAYLAPFLVPSEEDRHVVLFAYDALLALATFALVRRHAWASLGPVAFLLSFVTFAVWAVTEYEPGKFAATEIYLTVLCAIFLAVAREYWIARTNPKALNAALALAIVPVFYHLASLAVLFEHALWLLVYLIALTAVGTAVARDRPAIRLVLWVAVMLPFLAWLPAHRGTSWFAAAVTTAVALYGLHLTGQLRSLGAAPRPASTELTLLHFNAIGLFLSAYVPVDGRGWPTWGLAALLAAWNGLLAVTARTRVPSAVPHALAVAFALAATATALALSGPWLTVCWAAEGAAVTAVGIVLRRNSLRLGGSLLVAVAVARLVGQQFGATFVDFVPVVNSRTLAGAFIVALMYAVAWLYRARREELREEVPAHLVFDRDAARTSAIWIVAAHVLTLALATADIHSFWSTRETQLTVGFARQITISLTWAMYAMALIGAGFHRRSALLRYLALVIFGVTIVKVFAVDLLQVAGIYRITGFIVLGLVLLIASFLYQHKQRDGV